jgi:hypothetical protein
MTAKLLEIMIPLRSMHPQKYHLSRSGRSVLAFSSFGSVPRRGAALTSASALRCASAASCSAPAVFGGRTDALSRAIASSAGALFFRPSGLRKRVLARPAE